MRELEGAVTRLIGYARLTKQPITVDLARVALRDLFVQRRGQPTMEDIVRAVTDHFQVKLVDLQSKSRTSSIVLPRQIAMHLARRITTMSLGEIGGYFGGRDHSTVCTRSTRSRSSASGIPPAWSSSRASSRAWKARPESVVILAPLAACAVSVRLCDPLRTRRSPRDSTGSEDRALHAHGTPYPENALENPPRTYGNVGANGCTGMWRERGGRGTLVGFQSPLPGTPG